MIFRLGKQYRRSQKICFFLTGQLNPKAVPNKQYLLVLISIDNIDTF